MEYVQRELPYVRSFVLRSVYGVLRQEGITFGEEEPGRVIAEWREDGTDVSLSITAEEKAFGTELTVSLRRPCDGIPEQRAYRLLQEMLDQIVRHLENTLMTKGEEDAEKTPLQGTGGVRNDGDKMEENARRLVLRFHRHIRRVGKSQHFFGQFCFPGIRHTGVAGNV